MKTLLQAMDDPNLFKPWFKNPADWKAWRAFIACVFGLKLDPEAKVIFEACTGRTKPPSKLIRECHLICGRRAGKSFCLSLIAVYLAVSGKYKPFLQPGERATVMVIAADRKQARVIFRYIEGLLTNVPMLKAMLEKEPTKEGIDLKNAVTIEIMAASSTRTRGYKLVCVLADEIAFWNTDEESADPDKAILQALRPGMLDIPTSMLLCASSPYSKRGALFEAYDKHFGKNSDVLVWKAPTTTMNPSANKAEIEKAYAEDPASAEAEFGANFRSDIDNFISRDVVEAATIKGRFEQPCQNCFAYTGFADPSGGSGDSFTAAVCHRDPRNNKIIIDAAREVRPPFSPENAVSTCARLFKDYGINRIQMDRYAAQFPVELFSKYGITCLPSELNRSEIYHELLPLLNSGRIELLDNERANHQLLSLERRTTSSGKDSIDHPKSGKDDLINAIAGCAVIAASYKPLVITQEMLAASRQPPNRSIMTMGRKPPCYF